jgi:hypothetical protein
MDLLKDAVSRFAKVRDSVPTSVSGAPLLGLSAIPYND